MTLNTGNLATLLYSAALALRGGGDADLHAKLARECDATAKALTAYFPALRLPPRPKPAPSPNAERAGPGSSPSGAPD